MKKHFVLAASALLALLVLSVYASAPHISSEVDLPDGYLEAIRTQAAGVYSPRLPLVPVHVSVDRFVQDSVFYTIRYFPFGTVGMRFAAEDGYNIEKPLTGR